MILYKWTNSDVSFHENSMGNAGIFATNEANWTNNGRKLEEQEEHKDCGGYFKGRMKLQFTQRHVQDFAEDTLLLNSYPCCLGQVKQRITEWEQMESKNL